MRTSLKVIRHILATLMSSAFFGIVPLVLYGSWVIPRAVTGADLGGPLNFVIIPVAGALLGLVTSTLFFLPLGLLAERFRFRRWLCTVTFLALSLTAAVVIAAFCLGRSSERPSPWPGILVFTSLALYPVGGFFLYLSFLAVGRRFFPGKRDASPSFPTHPPAKPQR